MRVQIQYARVNGSPTIDRHFCSVLCMSNSVNFTDLDHCVYLSSEMPVTISHTLCNNRYGSKLWIPKRTPIEFPLVRDRELTYRIEWEGTYHKCVFKY